MSKPRKNPAAVALGRLGGKASWARLTPVERSKQARKMLRAREAKRNIKIVKSFI